MISHLQRFVLQKSVRVKRAVTSVFVVEVLTTAIAQTHLGISAKNMTHDPRARLWLNIPSISIRKAREEDLPVSRRRPRGLSWENSVMPLLGRPTHLIRSRRVGQCLESGTFFLKDRWISFTTFSVVPVRNTGHLPQQRSLLKQGLPFQTIVLNIQRRRRRSSDGSILFVL